MDKDSGSSGGTLTSHEEQTEEYESDAEAIVNVTPSAVQLKKFLAKIPRGCQHLALVAQCDGGSIEQIGAWPNDENLVPQLSTEIIATLREYVQAMRLDAKATLRFVAASGANVGQVKVMNAELSRPVATDFGSMPGELNGTNNSLVIQMQKHLEVMMRAHHQNTNATLHQSRQLTAHAVELANAAASARADAEERAEAARRENENLRERLNEALTVTQSDNPEDEATRASQATIMKVLENPQVQAMIMRGLMGGNGAPPAPPAS